MNRLKERILLKDCAEHVTTLQIVSYPEKFPACGAVMITNNYNREKKVNDGGIEQAISRTKKWKVEGI